MTHPTLSTTAVFRLMADGQAHSGTALAEHFGVSRMAVWKHIERLRELDLSIEAVAGQGYRLTQSCIPLDAKKIPLDDLPVGLDVLAETESTNSHLLKQPESEQPFQACLAEIQTAGRGRRGRSWLAPPGSGLCMSLAWRIDQLPVTPGAVSLAVGVWLIEALEALGFQGLGLKWPNDIHRGKAKLGGILIEMRGELDGQSLLVIGVGLNHQLPSGWGDQLDREIADLKQCHTGPLPDRNAIASACLSALITKLPDFAQRGFEPWRERWRSLDVLSDQAVQLSGSEPERGIARGVDFDGALLVEHQQQLHRVIAGEVSLRASGERLL